MDERGSWQDRIAGILNDQDMGRGTSYYKPGEIDDSAIVITVHRVSDDCYSKLADGDYSYVPTLVAS